MLPIFQRATLKNTERPGYEANIYIPSDHSIILSGAAEGGGVQKLMGESFFEKSVPGGRYFTV